jgi:DNA helicase-2/ATP-dependent DNA helicase PcrA
MIQIDSDFLRTKLNEAQVEAALNIKGPQLILAGAGSGKTRVITFKIAHLISQYQVASNQILAVTFTNKAAKEMKQRITTHLGYPVSIPWMGTFHSVCVRILRENLGDKEIKARLGWVYTGNFSIYDDSDQKALIKEVLKASGIEAEAGDIRKLRGRISAWKNSNKSPEAAMSDSAWYEEEKAAGIYASYQKKMAECNAMDFDDLLIKTVELLAIVPEIKERYRQKFQYLFVDEYQDTNRVQYNLLKLLCGTHQNITVVGDDDQSIYGWRGADIEIIRNFKRDYPNAHIVKLEQNYRSTQRIVQAAGSVIKNNFRPVDLQKNVFSKEDTGEPVHIIEISDEHEEARQITGLISANGPENYNQTAIFYRTNAQSRVLEEQLNRQRIPCLIYGGVRFYDRKEIKDVFGYLKLIINPYDDAAFLRVINVPRRGIGNTTLELIQAAANRHSTALLKIAEKATAYLGPVAGARKCESFVQIIRLLEAYQNNDSLPVLMEKVIEKSGYKEFLENQNDEEAFERMANLNELINGAVDWDQEHPGSGLGEFLQEVSLLTDADSADKENSGCVRLMTLHSAKGLEFPIVHLAGCDEGLFPLIRRGADSESEQDLKFEEERRLFYVGATRAEKALYIYSALTRKVHGRDERFSISRFVREMDESVCERVDLVPTFLRSPRTAQYSSAPAPNWQAQSRYQQKSRQEDDKVLAFLQRHQSPGTQEQDSDGQIVSEEISQENLYLELGSLVGHPRFGTGVVISCSGQDENARVEIRFNGGTTKKLILKYANLRILKNG